MSGTCNLPIPLSFEFSGKFTFRTQNLFYFCLRQIPESDCLRKQRKHDFLFRKNVSPLTPDPDRQKAETLCSLLVLLFCFFPCLSDIFMFSFRSWMCCAAQCKKTASARSFALLPFHFPKNISRIELSKSKFAMSWFVSAVYKWTTDDSAIACCN